jgi:hypothetical protein
LPFSLHLTYARFGTYEIILSRTSFGRLYMNDGVKDIDGASISVIDKLWSRLVTLLAGGGNRAVPILVVP